ncbi:DUF6442 family protein [Eubacteriaceae bacterium ES2]|nr:DUF6442 family protein [Eubacteriaceae bacterium ES2]
MKKEDILARSRESINDEGFEQAENLGRKIGFIIFCLLYIFIIVFNLFWGEAVVNHAVSSLFWAFFASEGYAKYRFSKQRTYLIVTIAGGLSSLLSLVNFILDTIG